MVHEETFIVSKENGVRPAGDQDKCFYCKQLIGDQHKEDCVLRKRTVVVRTVIDHVVSYPVSFDADTINFCRNKSSSCQNNILSELEELEERLGDGCLCGRVSSLYLREATTDDEERDLYKMEGV